MNPIRVIRNWLQGLISIRRQMTGLLADDEFGELEGIALRVGDVPCVCWTTKKKVSYGRFNDVAVRFLSDLTGPQQHQRSAWHHLLQQANRLLDEMEEPLRQTYEEIRVEWSLLECPAVVQAQGMRQLVQLDAIEINQSVFPSIVGFVFAVKWDADHDLTVHVVDGRVESVGVEG